jgi:hypothetical protein
MLNDTRTLCAAMPRLLGRRVDPPQTPSRLQGQQEALRKGSPRTVVVPATLRRVANLLRAHDPRLFTAPHNPHQGPCPAHTLLQDRRPKDVIPRNGERCTFAVIHPQSPSLHDTFTTYLFSHSAVALPFAFVPRYAYITIPGDQD